MSKIVISLNEKSIGNAIKTLKEYKKELDKKVKKLLDLMVRHGEDYAINAVGHIDTGETVSSIKGYRDGNKGVIVAGGNAIWLEFGTGVRNNVSSGSSPHPRGQDMGMLIGEYGQGKGSNPQGWVYHDGEGFKHTYGIQANLFMWNTARELERIAPELAREVFKLD